MPVTVKRYRIRGRVQGVGFRAFVWRRASELGLCGWVRNRGDGSVEALADGDARTLEILEEALRRGPSWARVDGVEVLDEPVAEPVPAEFTIIRDRI